MSMEVLTRHWEELSKKANYLNIALGTKFKDGKDTGVPAIVIYVSKKVDKAALAAEHIIPKEIEGIVTDVVEMAPTTWKAGKTVISQLHPEEQRRLLGYNGKPAMTQNSKATSTEITFSPVSDLRKWASSVRNQGNCGSCVGNGSIGVIEGKYRVQVNNPVDPIKLSTDDAFFCSGGSCEFGSEVPTILNYLLKNSVCSEACQPSKNKDITCGTGRCTQWWVDAKKLKNWAAITDIPTMKALLDNEPLIVVMAVPQSFFNYVSGIYKRLGPQDPIVGYHCIGNFGHNELELYWGPVQNSWDGWGEDGYFRIAFGECEIDTQMWQVEVDLNPIPAPPPPPPPLAITSLTLPTGMVGVAYSGILSASGGVPPYTWSINSGTLPAGLKLDASTGIVSGVPKVFSVVYLTFVCTDVKGTQAQIQLIININPPPPTPPPQIITTSLPNGRVNVPYSATLQASDGVLPYAWSVYQGKLPTGLSLSPGGVISGVPQLVGQSSISILVDDSTKNAQVKTFALIIKPPACNVLKWLASRKVTTGILELT